MINNLQVQNDWKSKLKKRLLISDFVSLIFATITILSLRFPEIWKAEINSYEVRNLILATLVFLAWVFFLWFNDSRDIKILGFGADEYKRLVNATFWSFTLVA